MKNKPRPYDCDMCGAPTASKSRVCKDCQNKDDNEDDFDPENREINRQSSSAWREDLESEL